jgi:hypothetical protein
MPTRASSDARGERRDELRARRAVGVAHKLPSADARHESGHARMEAMLARCAPVGLHVAGGFYEGNTRWPQCHMCSSHVLHSSQAA